MESTDRNITSIQYDHRNLAHLIVTDQGMHRYLYNSEGRRTVKQYKPHSSGSWTVNTRYIRGAFGEILAEYDGTQLQYWNILAAAGETLGRMDEDDETRYYYLKDHLGSVRVTIDDSGTIVGYDDYFPFGMQMSGRSWNQGNAFDDQKFTGHFLEQEGSLGIYHAGARLYDPEVPRFYGVDAMRGLYPSFGSYTYVFNNPVSYIDPTGNCAALMNAGTGKWEDEEARDLWAQCVEDQDPPESNESEDLKVFNNLEDFEAALAAMGLKAGASGHFWSRFTEASNQRFAPYILDEKAGVTIARNLSHLKQYIEVAKRLGYGIVYIDAAIKVVDTVNNPTLLNFIGNATDVGVGVYAAGANPYALSVGIIYFGGKYYMIGMNRAFKEGSVTRRDFWTWPAPYIPSEWEQ